MIEYKNGNNNYVEVFVKNPPVIYFTKSVYKHDEIASIQISNYINILSYDIQDLENTASNESIGYASINTLNRSIDIDINKALEVYSNNDTLKFRLRIGVDDLAARNSMVYVDFQISIQDTIVEISENALLNLDDDLVIDIGSDVSGTNIYLSYAAGVVSESNYTIESNSLKIKNDYLKTLDPFIDASDFTFDVSCKIDNSSYVYKNIHKSAKRHIDIIDASFAILDIKDSISLTNIDLGIATSSLIEISKDSTLIASYSLGTNVDMQMIEDIVTLFKDENDFIKRSGNDNFSIKLYSKLNDVLISVATLSSDLFVDALYSAINAEVANAYDTPWASPNENAHLILSDAGISVQDLAIEYTWEQQSSYSQFNTRYYNVLQHYNIARSGDLGYIKDSPFLRIRYYKSGTSDAMIYLDVVKGEWKAISFDEFPDEMEISHYTEGNGREEYFVKYKDNGTVIPLWVGGLPSDNITDSISTISISHNRDYTDLIGLWCKEVENIGYVALLSRGNYRQIDQSKLPNLDAISDIEFYKFIPTVTEPLTIQYKIGA